MPANDNLMPSSGVDECAINLLFKNQYLKQVISQNKKGL